MATDAQEKEKARRAREERRRYFAFLDRRIPELHALGVQGVFARRRADAEYGRAKRQQ